MALAAPLEAVTQDMINRIEYSEKYMDDTYEYRCVPAAARVAFTWHTPPTAFCRLASGPLSLSLLLLTTTATTYLLLLGCDCCCCWYGLWWWLVAWRCCC